jgi:hypothetical protein
MKLFVRNFIHSRVQSLFAIMGLSGNKFWAA